ncbi:peptidase inhibitor family I36 protein [Streptomyces viridochromogenes]|uniref:peptidase inhibitor family I36 protein n=1 Tax=Streptomyces viridochromogenes TaxID=1938 RepID=UPI00065CA365|nr:peptidase inhibitor family I36 protein [Streptomyces viridochromogenes]
MLTARTIAVAALTGAAVLTVPTVAFAEPDPDPVSQDVQHQRDLADGKLDPDHLRHKSEKDAQEAAMGIDTTPGALFTTRTMVVGNTAYFAPADMSRAGAKAAAEANNLCAFGDHCLYYNSGGRGANFKRVDTNSTIRDYAGYKFPAGLAGGGQPVKNNAAAVHNASGHYTFGVFYNSGWKGDREWFSPGTGGNLDYVKNENASGKSFKSW